MTNPVRVGASVLAELLAQIHDAIPRRGGPRTGGYLYDRGLPTGRRTDAIPIIARYGCGFQAGAE